mgnify:CR=1 FL=1
MDKQLQKDICNFKLINYNGYHYSNYELYPPKTRLELINTKFEFSNKPFIYYARFYMCKDLKKIINENINKKVYGKRADIINQLFKID